MRNLLLVIPLLGSLAIAACGGSAPAVESPLSDAPPASDAPAAKPLGEAQVGDMATCPVSGDTFKVTAESAKLEHEGKTYYFCCAGCVDKFKADPAKFLKKTGPS